jgi:tetratricopeptide (TPR) repeat protein
MNENDFRTRIAAGTRNLQDYREFGRILFSSGRHNETVSLYQHALTLPFTKSQKAQLLMELGWYQYELGELTHAESAARGAISQLTNEPETADVLFLQGMTESLLAHSTWQKDTAAAEKIARSALNWLQRLIAENPNFEEIDLAYLSAARIETLLGNGRNAVGLMQKYLQHDLEEDDRLTGLIDLAEALRLENRLTEAESAIKEALQYTQNETRTSPRLYFTLGSIYQSANDPAQARAAFERLLTELSGHPYLADDQEYIAEVRRNLGPIYYNLGEYEKAVETLQYVLTCYSEDNPYHANALLWLGRSYQALNAYTTARDCNNRVLKSRTASNAEKASAQQSLGELHYELGEYKKATQAFQKILAEWPERDTTWLWLGHAYLAQAEYVKARECYEKILTARNPTDAKRVWAEKGLGMVYYEQGDYTKAAAAFERAIVHSKQTESEYWNIRLRLGYCYEALSEYHKATNCFEDIIESRDASELDKKSAERARARIGAKLFYENGDYEDAAAGFRKVLQYPEDVPDRRAALLSLGRCYIAMKEYDRARESYEEVLASDNASEDEKTSARAGLSQLAALPKKSLH